MLMAVIMIKINLAFKNKVWDFNKTSPVLEK